MLLIIFVFTSACHLGFDKHPWYLPTECSLQLQDVGRGYPPPSIVLSVGHDFWEGDFPRVIPRDAEWKEKSRITLEGIGGLWTCKEQQIWYTEFQEAVMQQEEYSDSKSTSQSKVGQKN
ncbi:hypothetical protein F5J12DRAFT_786492 [Pisolithus orientalis]|uniref:uncharacterized protein n=1 Tax=Pisolithus orientalis TaxID=936130 RepID=UPI002224EEBF|nr:uncharacterized protein F5J12DRAFT_786492 [Pisolithus orientalis]KAI5990554.1 hypothetical protein F5J12DRAFT_786492 [Pisolithus orientalis]